MGEGSGTHGMGGLLIEETVLEYLRISRIRLFLRVATKMQSLRYNSRIVGVARRTPATPRGT